MNHLNRDAIIGFIVLVIIGLGCLWYVLAHTAPPSGPGTGATTTPAGTAATPLHITESGQYYGIDAAYPGSTPLAASAGADADAAAVAAMQTWEQGQVDTFKSDNDLPDLTPQELQVMQEMGNNPKYSLQITYTTYASAHTVSYVYQIFADTLGAHPNTTYKTFTFDTSTGALLGLSDVFSPGVNAAANLSTLARAKIPAQIAAAEQVDVSQVDMDMVNEGTTADPANFQDFYFDGSNFVVLFPPYAVGPYVLGLVTLTTPASQVPGLNPAYP